MKLTIKLLSIGQKKMFYFLLITCIEPFQISMPSEEQLQGIFSHFHLNFDSFDKESLSLKIRSCGYGDMRTNISSVVEFQRWWVLKSKLFGQESRCHQGKIFKKIVWVWTVCQKVPKSYFQSQFWMSKINRFFSKIFFYLRISI